LEPGIWYLGSYVSVQVLLTTDSQQLICKKLTIMTTLSNDLQAAGAQLTELIESFTDERFNAMPSIGKWTAGQVVDHILKSVGGLEGLMKGNTIKSERAFDEQVKILHDTFLDFTVKFESPEFVRPSNPPHDRQKLLKSANEIYSRLANFTATEDLSLLCTDFTLPLSPPMTRFEWAYFGLVHTQRHLRQLGEVRLSFNV